MKKKKKNIASFVKMLTLEGGIDLTWQNFKRKSSGL